MNPLGLIVAVLILLAAAGVVCALLNGRRQADTDPDWESGE